MAILEAALGHHPTWTVQIKITGGIDGIAELSPTSGDPKHGGLATDDYPARPWFLQEIESRAVNDGLRFFVPTTNSTASNNTPESITAQ
ncbi:hypothetical protein ACGF8B_30660 [Streptomyces sp. NPDC047917]|uniref:hypothetical protein n=1 Tax=Streptomyces sp. NPDC047917 TaxID=3365491 RepID=UPI003712E15B